MTTVQDWVSTPVTVNSRDSFRETSGQFPAVFVATNPGVFNRT